MGREKLLKVENIWKKFHGQHRYTLRNISLSVGVNQLYGIIGESGSGKSTLLEIMSRHDQETKGQIILKGASLPGPEETLMRGNKQVKLVKQDFDLFPNHTVEDILEHQIRELLQDEIDEKINWSLRYFDLEKARKKKPSELSGGMQQRLAIATAMISDPEIILMDEPFSHLDISRKTKLTRLVQKLVTEGRVSVVFVTHDMTDLLRYADVVAVIENGELVQEGNPRKIYENPVNLKTAKIVSEGTYLTAKEKVKFLNLFGKSHHKELGLYLRAEDLSIDEKSSVTLEVSASYYEGDSYLIELKFLSKKVFVKSENEKINGDRIGVSLKKCGLIFI